MQALFGIAPYGIVLGAAQDDRTTQWGRQMAHDMPDSSKKWSIESLRTSSPHVVMSLPAETHIDNTTPKKHKGKPGICVSVSRCPDPLDPSQVRATIPSLEKRTMTKNDLVVKIAAETGLIQSQVKQIIQMTLDGMIDCLLTEGNLELRNFGVFEVVTRKPRPARNPKTGQTVMVPERKVVRFKPGKAMEERVADGSPMPTQPTQQTWDARPER